MLMRAALEREGFAVVEAGNGVEALTVFEEHLPDAVLLDMYMPELDGISVCERIKQSHRPTVPVLIFTGSEETEVLHRAFTAGASDFLSKPIKYPVLPYHVRYMIRANNALVNQQRAELDIARLGRVIENSSNEIYIFEHPSLRLRQINNCSKRNLGYDDEDAGKLSMYDLSDDFRDEELLADLDRLFEGTRSEIRIDAEFKRKDGSKYPVEAGIYISMDKDSAVMFAIVQDVTQRKADEDQMRFMAYHDSLTNLPNRQALTTEISSRVQRSILAGNMVAVLFLDIDNFKTINDDLGHEVGDELLIRVAQNLMNCVRDEDVVARTNQRDGISVVRLGGDEFTVVLLGARTLNDAKRVAERILLTHADPQDLKGQKIQVSMSIGIGASPADGTTLEDLIKHADTAMRRAKQLGKNTIAFCNADLKEYGTRKAKIERSLASKLVETQFELHYQPIAAPRGRGEIIVEALFRWRHPELGDISPGECIPIAEESGSIIAITLWVFRRACRDYHKFVAINNGPVTISINISVAALRDHNLPEILSCIAEEERVSTADLILEITENVMMTDSDNSLRVLRGFSAHGFKLALDDFGSGYSSFAYLLAQPFDYIKIDRMFVVDIDKNSNCKTLVQAITKMAQSLGLYVIAEGIESEAQLKAIKDCGIRFIQGYLVSRPMKKNDLIDYLEGELITDRG